MWADMIPWIWEQVKTKGLIIALLVVALGYMVTRDNSNNAYFIAENKSLKLENAALHALYRGELREELVENQKTILANQAIELQKLTLVEEYIRMQTFRNQTP